MGKKVLQEKLRSSEFKTKTMDSNTDSSISGTFIYYFENFLRVHSIFERDADP